MANTNQNLKTINELIMALQDPKTEIKMTVRPIKKCEMKTPDGKTVVATQKFIDGAAVYSVTINGKELDTDQTMLAAFFNQMRTIGYNQANEKALKQRVARADKISAEFLHLRNTNDKK
ncbi:MAG: hypothetical protein J5742_02635 [Alphaproteobacteria bacterium]|nr:hypothetical protein [Alphaproteobacteria bacterium]